MFINYQNTDMCSLFTPIDNNLHTIKTTKIIQADTISLSHSAPDNHIDSESESDTSSSSSYSAFLENHFDVVYTKRQTTVHIIPVLIYNQQEDLIFDSYHSSVSSILSFETIH